MALTNSVKEKISIEVIKTLRTGFDNSSSDVFNNKNTPFHESFLRAFSEKLYNNVFNAPFFTNFARLNTTLEQTFFENVANIL
jgi:hypothetical protein